VVSSLVELLDEASLIVDFFNKWTEQKRIKKNIKRLIIENFDESLVEQVSSRFMDLARTKFDKS
jgi:type I restriction enzyme R subunit